MFQGSVGIVLDPTSKVFSDACIKRKVFEPYFQAILDFLPVTWQQNGRGGVKNVTMILVSMIFLIQFVEFFLIKCERGIEMKFSSEEFISSTSGRKFNHPQTVQVY